MIMGFFDKVKDFLDDGKINGSNAKPAEQQTAENTQPAVENTQTTPPAQPEKEDIKLPAGLTPEQEAAMRQANAIAEQQKAIREAAGIKEPERMSEEERNVPKDEIVELPFKLDASMMPYPDANGNNVCVKMFGKITAKAMYDLSDKELLALIVKSAPQKAYFEVLMKQRPSAAELPGCIEQVKQSIADTINSNRSDFELQSVVITSITG